MEQQNIFLIGFMGSGKSHWGRIWAERIGLEFYDLDSEIEKERSMTIAEIFDEKGEDYFREVEKNHLLKLENKNNFLVACGGGTPCFFDNIELMKSFGKVIYLKATPERLVEKLILETEKRPVIKEVNPKELLSFVQNKLQERETFYSLADEIVNVEELHEDSLSIVFKKIMKHKFSN